MTSDRTPTSAAATWRRVVTLIALLILSALVVGIAPVARAQAPGMSEHLEEMKWGNTLFVLLDKLEYTPGSQARRVSLDGRLWYGGAYRRVWMRAEGHRHATALDNNTGEGELQLLYGRLVHPFWDAVIGARLDRSWGGESAGRAHLAIGFIGLAPYRFELEPTLFVSERGDVSARLEAEFPVLITQRLVAEPAFEVNAALQSVRRFDVRSGFNDYEFGLRIRYEIRREFAPYIGWTRTQRVGGNGAVISPEPRAVPGTRFVMGLRLWH